MPSKTARKGGSFRREASWKDTQSKNKARKKTKLALIILAIILGIIIVGWSVRLTKNLFSSWKLSSGSFRTYVWSDNFNINVLLKGKEIALASYNTTDKKVTVIVVPDETLLDVPGGFGMWQARAVYDLGETQKKGEGNHLLGISLSQFFGLPIDGFLYFENSYSYKSSEEIVEIFRKNPFALLTILQNIKTDLTLWELIRLKFELAKVRFDKIDFINLADIGVLDRDYLLDQTPVFRGDSVKIDSISSTLTDPQIYMEGKTIAVFNATNYPALAQKGARIITNLGGNVIITANSDERLEKTKVFGEESKTLKRLRQIFGSDESSSVASRAQINIMLGEDFFNR